MKLRHRQAPTAEQVGFRKAGAVVMLRGRIVQLEAGGATALVLPEGFRPLKSLDFEVLREHGAGIVTIGTDGSVSVNPDLGSGWVELDEIAFPVE
jgi:hypothetical protein